MAKPVGGMIGEAREAFDAAVEAERENMLQAEQDLRFLAGEQWDEQARRERLRTGRPALTINRLPQYIRQVTGDIRLNPPGILVRPVDGGADPETAKTYNGLIRNIEAQSNGKAAYVGAAENAVRCGVGAFRITYDYAYESSFYMELGIGRIPSPFAAVFYAGTTEPTGCDAEGVFVQELIPLADFKKRFPKASLTSWDDQSIWGDWREGDYIRVAEWWRKVPQRKRLILCANGKTFDATDWEDAKTAQVVQMNGGFVRERMADSHRVEMRLMSGTEQLEDTAQWPSCWLPIVRCVGEEINVGEKLVRHGLVRFARDPQVLYNVMRSSLAEAAAIAPKVKWLGTDKQFAANRAKWAQANQLNLPYLAYTPDDKAPGPPQRIAPEMPAAALLQEAASAAQDLETTIGIYRENLGKESNAQSGRAILSRQREGDVGTFLYMDNLAEAVTQAGRILVDMIPRIYDTPRQVRVLGEDGSEEFVQINQPLPDGTIANDLSVGRYDVVASVGPSFSTRREEARESMISFFQAVPAAAQAAGDLFAKANDWPGADEFANRMRRMAIMSGMADPDPQNEDDAKIMQALAQKGQQPDPNAMLAQAEMAKAQAAQFKAETDRLVEQERLRLEQAKVMLEAMRAEMEAQQAGQKLSIQAADVASKVEERRASTMREGVKGTVDVLERVLRPRPAPQMSGDMEDDDAYEMTERGS